MSSEQGAGLDLGELKQRKDGAIAYLYLETDDEGIVDNLKRHIDDYANALTTRIETLEAERAELRAALKWYADTSNYDENGAPYNNDLSEPVGKSKYTFGPDLGDKARAALNSHPEADDE